ncbi:hypothetical protein DICA3_E27248 [Diutina catenulata]
MGYPTNGKRRARVVIEFGGLKYFHSIMFVSELQAKEQVSVLEVTDLNLDTQLEDGAAVSFCLEYTDDSFFQNMSRLITWLESVPPSTFSSVPEVTYHVHWAPHLKWHDYSTKEKDIYTKFMDVVAARIGEQKVSHVSIIQKYDIETTVSITDPDAIDQLAKEVCDDVVRWRHLKILDYGVSSIRFLPTMISLADTLELFNIGGGYALETLGGFRMPRLRALIASQNALHSVDDVQFPSTLRRLELSDNKIYFLSCVNFPPFLEHLDVSQNRIDSLKGVNLPSTLMVLNLSFNPIEQLKGVRFPDGMKYLDVSNIANESMAGVRFPDSLINLNLQASMTTTRGLKLPQFLTHLTLCDNNITSINPLRLPPTLQVLYLNNNAIKTLNKVTFPPHLRELYLGNNLITTLKNVHFPPSLEVLDMDMDPDLIGGDDEFAKKQLTSIKDAVFPRGLRVLKLGYHAIKSLELVDLSQLTMFSACYNDLRTVRGLRFHNLKLLDLAGNRELGIDHLLVPESVTELRVASEILKYLPPYLVDRVNSKQLLLRQSLPY